jgi:hypothetical protein
MGNTLEIFVGGLRALVFMTALFSASVFLVSVEAGWGLICAIFRGRVRGTHLIGLAAFGWFLLALSRMMLSFHRLMVLVIDHKVLQSHIFGFWDGFSMIGGMIGLSIGFYAPVLALLWYRRKLDLALLMGGASLLVAFLFAALTARYLPY